MDRVSSEDPANEIDTRRALDCLSEAVLVTDANGRLRYANPAAERLLGEHVSKLLDRPADELLCVRDARSGETLPNPVTTALDGPPWLFASAAEHDPVLLLGDGEESIPVRLSAHAMLADDSTPTGVVISLQDDTDARTLRQALVDHAAQDPLTRLVNRAEFAQRVDRLLGARDGPHALLFLDLDRFKDINERWGHAAGDYALREITRLFAEMIRTRDTFARLGGDEFGLLLEHCGPSVAEQIASSFHATLVSRPLIWQEKPFPLSISVGGTLIRSDEHRDVETLMEVARAACDTAKDDDARPVKIET